MAQLKAQGNLREFVPEKMFHLAVVWWVQTPPGHIVSRVWCRHLCWGGLIAPTIITIVNGDLVLTDMTLRVPKLVLGGGGWMRAVG